MMNYLDFINNHFKKAKILYNSFFNYFFGKILSNRYLSSENKIYIEKTFQINLGLFEQLNINQDILSIESQIQKKRNNNNIIKISIIIIYSNLENLTNVISLINNQIFEYYEIILIFDNEEEKIDEIFINYIKSFENIKLIKNNKTKGKIYSIYKAITFI